MNKLYIRKLISVLWLVTGLIGSGVSLLNFYTNYVQNNLVMRGAGISLLLATGFSMLVILTSIGLLLWKAWARWLGIILSVLLIAYSFSYIFIVSLEFGFASFFGMIFLLVFSLCSATVFLKVVRD